MLQIFIVVRTCISQVNKGTCLAFGVLRMFGMSPGAWLILSGREPSTPPHPTLLPCAAHVPHPSRRMPPTVLLRGNRLVLPAPSTAILLVPRSACGTVSRARPAPAPATTAGSPATGRQSVLGILTPPFTLSTVPSAPTPTNWQPSSSRRKLHAWRGYQGE